ncbi:hypothetical protein ANOM_004544 [Aspergillus nomiae NRRL 13137]|uniref:Uncharacterized protein n=1 Tax=Aspergillus nomiae NRRL (strain ATCC 15546 / NRRL 13137 / CBS 260.88 / M93) TaxID=1509407 RepID=A0A0L1J8H0_ASPN3|nr:uncharacterized protein ANOM_004544 [Aspergillus nomiae NRRL 13137]KNG87970.1 hypothetical protein ANOM_004544 [Aspergillus nomiae NRRL 13137]
MYIDTLFPDGLYHPLLPRATYASCWGGIGQGECRGQSDCIASLPPPLNSRYSCGPNWPCPGISSIQCCVTYENMSNGTSTVSSTSSTTSPTSTSNSTSTSTTPSVSSPTTSAAAPAAESKQGLSGSQIGGIVGGVVGAAFLLGVIALFLFFRRRTGKRDLAQEGPDAQGPASEAGKPVEEEVVGKDLPMLEGTMRQEMDAQGGAALHEMEGASGRGVVGVGGEKGAGLSELEGQRTVVAELDGASVVRGSGG